MKRILIIFLMLSLSILCSCEKTEEPIDYSVPLTIYIKGNDSYAKPISDDASIFRKVPNEYYSLTAIFSEIKDQEAVVTVFRWPLSTEFKKGEAIEPNFVALRHNWTPSLGLCDELSGGRIICMGHSDGLITLQFEDVTFRVKREDGSEIIDVYYLRGTHSFKISGSNKNIFE